jgi:flagellar biosynthesis protein
MTDKSHSDRPLAIALRWEGSGAPRVTAKGRGEVAKRILELAAKHAVPLREDPALVEVLSLVDLGREIPAPLYQAVAEVIAFAYSLHPAEKSRPRLNE